MASPSSSPSAPSAPSPSSRAADPQLLSLPSPRRAERRVTGALLLLTATASLALLGALRGEITYALARPIPVELGNVSATTLDTTWSNRYVHATGLLSATGVLSYERFMEGDSFRLAPVAGNPLLWVEVRVPQGMDGATYLPPKSLVGRLVPFREAGIRHQGLRAHAAAVPAEAWLLVDGASPRASRWSLALAGLLVYFFLWNVVGFFRLQRPAALIRRPRQT